jgi:small basic protein
MVFISYELNLYVCVCVFGALGNPIGGIRSQNSKTLEEITVA